MTTNTFPQRSLNFLIPVLGSVFLILPILIGLAHPKAMQGTDFLMTFFLAGKLLLENRAADLYPALSSSSFVDSPFNTYAHQIFGSLPSDFAAAYMYSPLTALSFIPFSIYDPANALLCWQLISLVALAISASLVSDLTGSKTSTTFFLYALFFPITHTLFIGQLGLLLGMLPLSIGYYLLVKNRALLAGIVWSTLLFKPHFLPIVFFVAFVLSSAKRFRCLIGLLVGLAVLASFAFLLFGAQICELWLHCLQLASGIDTNPSYGYPSYMKCSLPAAVLALMPAQQRPLIEPFVNMFVFLIAAHGIWTAMNFLHKNKSEKEKTSIVFLIAMLMLPLLLPHFFYYDLCVFAMIGSFIFSKEAPFGSALRKQTIAAWLIINFYMLCWAFVNPNFAQPLIIVLIDAFIYWRVLQYSSRSI
jgi:Glycosyltransferase family 87